MLKSKGDEFSGHALGQTSCEVVITDNENMLDHACQISQNFVVSAGASSETTQCSRTSRDKARNFVTVAEKINGNQRLSVLKVG